MVSKKFSTRIEFKFDSIDEFPDLNMDIDITSHKKVSKIKTINLKKVKNKKLNNNDTSTKLF